MPQTREGLPVFENSIKMPSLLENRQHAADNFICRLYIRSAPVQPLVISALFQALTKLVINFQSPFHPQNLRLLVICHL